jgi:hypothetical protein
VLHWGYDSYTERRFTTTTTHIDHNNMSSSAQTLRQLPSVRQRCETVYKLAQQGKVDHFVLDEDRYQEVIDVCAKAINVGQPSRSFSDSTLSSEIADDVERPWPGLRLSKSRRRSWPLESIRRQIPS